MHLYQHYQTKKMFISTLKTITYPHNIKDILTFPATMMFIFMLHNVTIKHSNFSACSL